MAKKDSPSWYWKVNDVITLLLYLIIANEGRLNTNSSVISLLVTPAISRRTLLWANNEIMVASLPQLNSNCADT